MSLNPTLAGLRASLVVALATAGLMAAVPAHAINVIKDPVTGALRAPTGAELAQSRAAAASTLTKGQAARTAQPRGLLTGKVNPEAIVRADGTIFQELDESTLQYSTVTRNPDGSLNFECVTGKEAADAVVKGKKTSRIAKEHVHAEEK